MKAILSILLTSALTVPLLAQDATTNAALEKMPAATNAAPAGLTFSASAATVTAPMVLTSDCLSQPDTTDLAGGGKAIFNFTITNAGSYLIGALVSAADEGANSLFLNVDANLEDPGMIWDIDVTSGYEQRTVNWRGNGDAEKDQFVPKSFKLTAGAHKLILVGREPVQLKCISIRPAAN